MNGGLESVQVAILLSVCMVSAGVVAGLTGRITVYRNYGDVAWCFALLVVPLGALWFGISLLGDAGAAWHPVWVGLCALLALGLLAVIARRTWEDNGGLLSTALALLTKIPLGVLYVAALAELIGPSGRTAEARSRARQWAFFALFLLTPLLVALTRDKGGFSARPARWR